MFLIVPLVPPCRAMNAAGPLLKPATARVAEHARQEGHDVGDFRAARGARLAGPIMESTAGQTTNSIRDGAF